MFAVWWRQRARNAGKLDTACSFEVRQQQLTAAPPRRCKTWHTAWQRVQTPNTVAMVQRMYTNMS